MSRHQLKILTFAPELLSRTELRRLVSWAKLRKITLSVGHSLASEAQAREAFSLGCQGLTHAWNAMKFHHRSPGALGAALGRPGVSVEVILDLIHLSPTLVRWTRKLHAPHPLCFVSDCVPATLTRKGSEHSFGPLKIRWEGGACRTPDGNLAGGGILLPQAFARWVEWEAQDLGLSTPQAYALLRKQIPFLTEMPLRYLALETKIAELKKRRPVEWAILSTEKHVQVKIEPLF
jgi:N-acetylglucosamine-6-phosphate deacetylase